MPSQTNSLGTAFGGQVMAWIDVCAAVAAQRFCRKPVVTAAADTALTVPYLDAVLFFLGIRREDIEAADA